jgi:uncharacterized membrane protein (UPF0127 family)
LIIVFFFRYSYAGGNYTETVIVNINNKNLKLVVAESHETRAKGLSDRKQIPYDGMIFLFKKLQKPAFWMKNMHFAIDILWIADNKVVDISENVKPEHGVAEHFLKRYSPSQNVNTVIELSAGRAKQLNIKTKDIIKYN